MRVRALLADDDGLLGDAFYTLTEAQAATAQVQRLAQFYEARGRPAQFSTAVGSLLSRFKAAAELADKDSTPAVGAWGTLVALGREAEQITNRIAVATGAEPPPSLQPEGGLADQIGKLVALIGLVAVGGVVVVKALNRENRNAR